MSTISPHLERLAQATIKAMLLENKKQLEITDAPGFIVFRSDFLPEKGVIPIARMEEENTQFTICQDRR